MHYKPNLMDLNPIERIFNILNKPIDMSVYMYNSGIIFIPREKRVQIAQQAIDLIIEMNKYNDVETRGCNRLDEQLAVTFYIQQHFHNGMMCIMKRRIYRIRIHVTEILCEKFGRPTA